MASKGWAPVAGVGDSGGYGDVGLGGEERLGARRVGEGGGHGEAMGEDEGVVELDALDAEFVQEVEVGGGVWGLSLRESSERRASRRGGIVRSRWGD